MIVALVFLAAGCRQEFSPYLEKAEKAFASRDYINTVDALNAGLPHWRSSDGDAKKARAFELLGLSYQNLRNTAKAVDAYQQSAKIAPAYTPAYNLGNLYALNNQPKLAMASFQQALRAKPDDPLALLGLANSLYALHRFSEAAQTFQRVIDVSPGVADAIDSLKAIRGRHRR